MHGERTRVSDGVGNKGSGGEYNNQTLSGINSAGNAVHGDGGGGGCSGETQATVAAAAVLTSIAVRRQ
jgi:hypothetical protein